MKLFGHNFTTFKSCERICWSCGYVIDRESDATEAADWMIDHEGGFEPWCGGTWHKINLRKPESEQ